MEVSIVTTQKTNQKMQQLRPDRHMFSTSDDQYEMLKQVEATHAPDGRQFALKPLLYIIDDIFQRAAPSVPGFVQGSTQAQQDLLDDKAFQSGLFDMLDILSITINKVSCEISCKCSSTGGDAHATTLGIFNNFGSYAWDAKLVLAMAAFALNYGEFWLVAQLYSTNPLAKSIALLKQLPAILEKRADTILKSKFEALSNLVKAMLDVTKCTLEFKELPSKYITPDTPEMVTATANIPTAVYWTIRSSVACSAQIMGLIGMGHECIVSTAESWELSSLAHKLESIHTLLKNQLNLCYKIIDEKTDIEAYQALVTLTEKPDIEKFLRALIYAKDDQLPLVEGCTGRRAGLDVLLRKKNVLLLISDLDISHDELFFLKQMYQESRQNPTKTESQYEVVWMPVVDRTTPWTKEMQKQFETLQSMMPWYSIYHPSMVDQAVIRYVKEFWNFKKNPILVVLDLEGKVVNTNSLHMVWIWGSLAFPFTSSREEALWKEESWTLELLAGSVDAAIPVWIAEEKYICLYGGEDIEWIRKITKTAQEMAAKVAGIPLELLYVGKSNPKEKVRRNIDTIAAENLSHTLQDMTQIWFFWVRLESMWQSKMKHGKSEEDDQIMQEIVTMLSFDGSGQGWAIICQGSEMAKSKGDTILKCFGDYELWKSNANKKGVICAINDHLHELYSPHHCNHLILPGTSGTIPEKIVCTECGQAMEKFIMYRCCTE